MSSGSIIIFGILSAGLMILSCISLNASTFYTELGVSKSFVLKPTFVLRDRSIYILENLE